MASLQQTFGITVKPAALVISSGNLPNGQVGVSYTFTLTATGGTPPYTWTATNVPAGLTLNSTSGVLSGTPTVVPNPASITVTLTDSGP